MHVEQDDVDAPVEVLTRLVERPRLTNLVPVQLEIHLAEQANRRLVVDHQHNAFGAPRDHEAGV